MTQFNLLEPKIFDTALPYAWTTITVPPAYGGWVYLRVFGTRALSEYTLNKVENVGLGIPN